LGSRVFPKIGWKETRNYFRLDLNMKSLYDKLFIVLFIVDVVLRMIWLDKPTGSLIFDEWYYVNVARVILGIPQSIGGNGQPPFVGAQPGLDPNHEHPPLAKLLIALSMQILGNNGYGWRIPSVIFGSVGVLVFYLLMKKIATYKMVPLVATFLFSFDNLVFVQSRIATLDIFALTFMLLGLYWYFSGHNYLSSIGMALSALTKITGVAGFLVIAMVHAARFATTPSKRKPWNEFFSWFEKYTLAYLASFLLILTVLDRLWVGYSNPLTHIQYILNYSTALVSTCPNGIMSCPWQWLLNQIQIPYLVVSVQVTAGSSATKYDSIAFWGAMNPAILYLTIPAMLYTSYSYLQEKRDLTLLTLVWFAVTYLPYYPAVIFGQRVTYLFYFLATVPAVCAAVAHMIADQNPPKLVVLFYLGVVLVSFYMMFPFKVVP
jgi:predicted membrane-bound dolichyl-phosphate-mannose-protein mannosyltransferase